MNRKQNAMKALSDFDIGYADAQADIMHCSLEFAEKLSSEVEDEYYHGYRNAIEDVKNELNDIKPATRK